MNTPRIAPLVSTIALILMLSACGQKGDLYLPDRNPAAPASTRG